MPKILALVYSGCDVIGFATPLLRRIPVQPDTRQEFYNWSEQHKTRGFKTLKALGKQVIISIWLSSLTAYMF